MKKIIIIFLAVSISLSSGGPLPDKTVEECIDICPANFAPICGSNDISYSNICLLNQEACRTQQKIEVKSPGPCGSNKESDTDKDPCSKKCASTFEPICGSDGLTYNNECQFQLGVCRNSGLTKDYEGICIVVSGAPKKEETKSEEKKNARSAEENQDEATDTTTVGVDCKDICPRNYKPVCGSNGVTYSNTCQLSVEKCKTDSKLEVTHVGPCDPTDTIIDPSKAPVAAEADSQKEGSTEAKERQSESSDKLEN